MLLLSVSACVLIVLCGIYMCGSNVECVCLLVCLCRGLGLFVCWCLFVVDWFWYVLVCDCLFVCVCLLVFECCCLLYMCCVWVSLRLILFCFFFYVGFVSAFNCLCMCLVGFDYLCLFLFVID